MVTRLHESFGDPLLIRPQRGIVPTDAAPQPAAIAGRTGRFGHDERHGSERAAISMKAP